MSGRDLAGLLDQHASLTGDLADALHELGDTRSAQILAKRDLWDQTSHLNITERRETINAQTADLTAEIERMLGEIEALRAQLAHLELRITHGDT